MVSELRRDRARRRQQDEASRLVERRFAPRVVLQAPVRLLGDDQVGPADVSCTGVGVLVRAAPPVGATVSLLLPPDGEEPRGLELVGRVVVRSTLQVTGPLGTAVAMHACVVCGWTAARGEPPEDGARAAAPGWGRMSARAAKLSFPDPAALARCPSCQAFSPIAVGGALHRVGLRLDLADGTGETGRLRRYLERAIETGVGAVTDRRRDPSADGALEIERSVETIEAVRWTFPRGPERGLLRFVDGREIPLGTRVRVVLRASSASADLDVEARIVSVTYAGGQTIYLGSFEPASSREHVHRFVEETSSRPRASGATRRRRWFRLGLFTAVALAGAAGAGFALV